MAHKYLTVSFMEVQHNGISGILQSACLQKVYLNYSYNIIEFIPMQDVLVLEKLIDKKFFEIQITHIIYKKHKWNYYFVSAKRINIVPI